MISRSLAYHGTPQGALAITGLPGAKQYFEPLVPGGHKVPNTNFYRAPVHADDHVAYGRWAADQVAQAIEFEGPDTVAAVFLEPVQNSGGCFPPPPGYFQRLREICDQYDVLLVSDEVICAFGRLGTISPRQRYGYQPGHAHLRQGPDLRLLTARRGDHQRPDRRTVPARHHHFMHGYDLRRPPGLLRGRAGQPGHLRARGPQRARAANEDAFRSTLEKLHDLPIVGDVRGDGYFYGIELVKDKATKHTLRRRRVRAPAARLPVQGAVRRRPVLPRRRPGRPGRPARPAADLRPAHFDEIEQILRSVLTEAWTRL